MNRSNRKKGLSLTPTVFYALHKALLNSFKDHYQLTPDTLVDYQLYGFNYYDESLPSIKKMIFDNTGKWVNGKYLYNKYREWKKGANPIQFTREFVFIYFQTLGLKDINEFVGQSSLSELAIEEQLGLEKPIQSVQLKEDYYVGYFQGEEGTIIYCELTLAELAEQAQISLIYWEDEKEYSEYHYQGTILYQQNGMSLFFKNEDTILDRSQFIGIYCERQVKVKPFLVGTISGYDRDRRPVVGEIVFQRMNSKEELKSITKNKQVSSIIAQYLSGRRWIVNNRMIQNLSDLSPESKHSNIIENFIRHYKGLFVAIENGIFIVELTVKDNTGNATFSIAGHPLYKGVIKVQVSGQLLIGRFTNVITQAPLFISIEVVPIRGQLHTGDLMGVSRFDKSFSGKLYLSTSLEIIEQLPKYRGSALATEEIQKLPKEILSDLTSILKNNRLEEHFQSSLTANKTLFIDYLVGSYSVTFADDDLATADLHIEEDGHAFLKFQHFVYEGKATMCEGAVLSIYFTTCNGIHHCGQIMAKIGRVNPATLKQFEASWHYIDEEYSPQCKRMKLGLL